MHKKKIISNSLLGVLNKIVILLLGFVSRKIFIVFLGEEVLGLNSLYANLLDLLNLADLGVGIALQYQLFEPLVKNDKEKLSKIVSIAKKIYNSIGCFILLVGIVLSFFIQYLIKSTPFPLSFVRISFIISVLGVSLSYFFVHKRLFLQANEQLGLVDIVDMITRIVVISISLVCTAIFKNYFLYLGINVSYSLVSNIFVLILFSKKYPDIHDNCKDYLDEKEELRGNLKNVISLKITNYIYYSTDNVIISKFLGLTTVALYSNYMTIINGLMGIEHIYGSAVTSSMGKIIKENSDKKQQFSLYLIFQYAQFIITNFFAVSVVFLATPFMKMWLGDRFLLADYILAFLVLDFYVHSMYQPAAVMYGSIGMFKQDKIVTWISAILNLSISLVLVFRCGLLGVIIGTMITDIYLWIIRSYQIVYSYFGSSIWIYTLKMIKYVAISCCSIFVTYYACSVIATTSIFVEIVCKAVICIIVPNVICLITTKNSDEYMIIKNKILNRSSEVNS